jgi:hypothetical protein
MYGAFDLHSFGQLIGALFASVALILPVLHVNRDQRSTRLQRENCRSISPDIRLAQA